MTATTFSLIKNDILLNKTKWTSKAPYAATCPLTLEWIDDQYRPSEYIIPKYVCEVFVDK